LLGKNDFGFSGGITGSIADDTINKPVSAERKICYHSDMEKKHKDIRYFIKTLSIVFGLVMIWRGVWYVLDDLDTFLFGGYNSLTGLLGIALGTLLLYLPDRDLKEIEKL
jgi:hypothetical protein